ncbi:AAA family ATPase [bacterium]|nr:MAG: AAA family ATPase [bacterium]
MGAAKRGCPYHGVSSRKGVSSTYAVKIYKAYKQQAIELMLENPYRIAEDIWGIGFAIADTIAQKLSVAPDSVKRFRAALLHVLSTSTQNGHVYVELESLKKATAELLSLDVAISASKVKIVLHDLYNEEKIKLVSKGQEHFIALAFHYKAEKGIADLLLELQKATSFLNIDQNKLYELLRTDQKNGAQLHEQQQKGVMSVFTCNVTIITGGPGTGKTTLVKSVLNLCDQFAVSYKLAAPTGRAAKRLTQSANRQAVTLHRLLEFDPATMQFTKNAQNALDCKLLVVDEASMIDIFLMYALLKAVARGTHLVFIGDVDQLPSVGSGNVLSDLIQSDLIPTVRLTHIFRQAHESLIVTNAHRINKGEFFVTFDETTPHAKDFYFIKEENPDTIQEHLRHVFKSVLVQKKIALDATAVLVPMNRGSVGTVALNQMLQNLLNPRSDDAIVYGSYTFKVSDRVMQIRNNYDKHVFNGDIGTVVLIDKNEKELHVQFDQLVVYDFSELDELVLAYAISIHKSQGSEYDAVIIPLFMQHYTLLQRKLLYTAVTRAKKICILIGQPKAFWTAIRNSVTQVRLTLLKDFLASNLSAR